MFSVLTPFCFTESLPLAPELLPAGWLGQIAWEEHMSHTGGLGGGREELWQQPMWSLLSLSPTYSGVQVPILADVIVTLRPKASTLGQVTHT